MQAVDYVRYEQPGKHSPGSKICTGLEQVVVVVVVEQVKRR